MNLLTITEEDGTTTRLNVGADNIALEVAHFYKKIIKLGVSIQNVDATPKLENEEEQARADRYMKEWRMFGKGLVRIK